MDFEKCKDVFISDGEDGDIVLKPHGRPAEFGFSCEKREDKRYKLFVSGETGLFYMWRDEPDYPATYHTITDALSSEVTMRAQYSLDVSRAEAEKFEWRAYKKIMWPPALSYLALTPVGNGGKSGSGRKRKT